jgi:hypothetical protein
MDDDDGEGIPVDIETFAGDTTDPATQSAQIGKVKQRLMAKKLD